MKKLFLVGAIAISAVALASTTNSAKPSDQSVAAVYQDTVPGKKKDTTSMPRRDTAVPPTIINSGK